MMKPSDRQAWLLSHLATLGTGARVDVLNRWFVDDFIRATGASFSAMPYGANKCITLGRDLSTLYNTGKLVRHPTGIEGLAGMGFPRWVYSYSLPKEKQS